MATIQPLPLDNPRWSELSHAYGPAVDTPGLLGQLLAQPNRDVDDPVWDQLFGSICHQGSVYEASFAAMPHLANIAERAEPRPALWALNLITAIAVSQNRRGKMPPDLAPAYESAVARLSELAVRALSGADSFREVAICCGAIMAGRGWLEAASHIFDPIGDDQYTCPHCEERLV